MRLLAWILSVCHFNSRIAMWLQRPALSRDVFNKWCCRRSIKNDVVCGTCDNNNSLGCVSPRYLCFVRQECGDSGFLALTTSWKVHSCLKVESWEWSCRVSESNSGEGFCGTVYCCELVDVFRGGAGQTPFCKYLLFLNRWWGFLRGSEPMSCMIIIHRVTNWIIFFCTKVPPCIFSYCVIWVANVIVRSLNPSKVWEYIV